MFDLLKKKLSTFSDKLRKKTEEKAEKEAPPAAVPEDKVWKPMPAIPEKPGQAPKPPVKPAGAPPKPATEQLIIKAKPESIKPAPAAAEKPAIPKPAPIIPEKPAPPKPAPKPKPEKPIAVQPAPAAEKKEGRISPLKKYIKKVKKALEKEEAKKPEPKPIPKKPGVSVEERIKKIEKTLEGEKEKVKEEPAPPKPAEPEKKPEPKPVPKEPPLPEKPKEEFKLKKMSDLLEAQAPEKPPAPGPKPAAPSAKPMSPAPAEAAPKVPAEAIIPEAEAVIPSPEKRELKTKLGALGALKGAIKGHILLKEGDVADLLFELELSLLEADVNHETAKAFVEKIRALLLNEKIPRGTQLNEFLKEKIKVALTEMTETRQMNIFELIEQGKKPFKILFLGPNGAGKTTTIAKLTYSLKQVEKSVIWAAADTFRAASIEQLEEHAKRLHIRVVKHKYGADPTAVAFDAVKAAEAAKADVVMIDSAGRQETNRNLVEELKKMERVIKPDLKIFIGEAFAGKNLIEQARAFDKAVGIDGFILSKIDTDAKGGTVLSLLYELKKPVLFIGTGQKYTDLIRFTPQFVIDRIV